MVTELFYIPYILVSIPGLKFVIGILLFLFDSVNVGTYISLSLVANP
jgi:hypothetical protein